MPTASRAIHCLSHSRWHVWSRLSSLGRALTLPLVLAAFSSGCLPDPEIHVPDFGLPPVADLAMPVRMDGPSGDLGAPLWSADNQLASVETLRAAWVADPAISQAYVVGHNGTVLHRVGGDWKLEPVSDAGKPVKLNLYAVAAAGVDTVYAVGEAGVILRRVAGVWQREGKELGSLATLFGVTVLPSGEVIAVGDAGTIVRRQTAGIWVPETTMGLGTTGFRAVAGTDADGLYAVGMGAVIAKRGMDKWELDPATIDLADRGNYYAVSSSSAGVFVAGEYGKVLRREASRWQREMLAGTAAPSPPHLFGLAMTASDLFVVGAGGLIQRRDMQTATWSNELSGGTSALYGVAGAGARSILTVGALGTVLRRL